MYPPGDSDDIGVNTLCQSGYPVHTLSLSSKHGGNSNDIRAIGSYLIPDGSPVQTKAKMVTLVMPVRRQYDGIKNLDAVALFP